MKEYKLPIGCDVPETIILADGDFPSHSLALEWLRQCPYVVCCSGCRSIISYKIKKLKDSSFLEESFLLEYPEH